MNHPPDHGQHTSGLLILHFYYWSANQFIVQRALAARSDREARLGIVTAVFKLLIPFMSIGTAWPLLLFQATAGVRSTVICLSTLDARGVALVGFGLQAGGAGLIGAILSVSIPCSIGCHLDHLDIYKRFINPQANEKQLIRIGRFASPAL